MDIDHKDITNSVWNRGCDCYVKL